MTDKNQTVSGEEPMGLSDTDSIERVDAPFIYGSRFLVQVTDNDVMISVQRTHPILVNNTMGAGVKVETTAVVTMGFQAAKNLSVALAEAIEKLEALHGSIDTAFLRSRAAAADKT